MRALAITTIAIALILPSSQEVDDTPPEVNFAALRADELVVLVRPGPLTWHELPDGSTVGLDADLARLLAARLQRRLRVVPMADAVQIVESVARGKAHIGAGGLFRPAPPSKPRPAVTFGSSMADQVLWSRGYLDVEPVVIYNVDGFKPANWRDLANTTVGYSYNSGLDAEIAALRRAHPEVAWKAIDVPTGDALVAQVSDGQLNYAVVSSVAAAVARNIYLDFDIAFPVDGSRELAWALPPPAGDLRAEIDAFFSTLDERGTLRKLIDRYFGHMEQVPRIDAGILQERIRSHLPQYRPIFQRAQQLTGIEWRLLAAVAYQESQWDPLATSATGVRGMMQLTEETAKHLGVMDRLDPHHSILAAAQYIVSLKKRLPERIREPDRTWLALAAFNIGYGHLEDARILARHQRLDPDSWSDVRKTLPLLAEPAYYVQARSGYARGGMPVAFVDRVRAYYDVLLAHQPGFQPRLDAGYRAEREPGVGGQR